MWRNDDPAAEVLERRDGVALEAAACPTGGPLVTTAGPPPRLSMPVVQAPEVEVAEVARPATSGEAGRWPGRRCRAIRSRPK